MTPTKDQIEAAAKAIWVADNFPTPWEKGFEDDRTHYSKLADAALTAAAEVGEPDKWETDYRKVLVRATIERCAQVAEKYLSNGEDVPYDICEKIAAAIRALKDQP